MAPDRITITSALPQMCDRGFRHLPVIDNGKIVGVVSWRFQGYGNRPARRGRTSLGVRPLNELVTRGTWLYPESGQGRNAAPLTVRSRAPFPSAARRHTSPRWAPPPRTARAAFGVLTTILFLRIPSVRDAGEAAARPMSFPPSSSSLGFVPYGRLQTALFWYLSPSMTARLQTRSGASGHLKANQLNSSTAGRGLRAVLLGLTLPVSHRPRRDAPSRAQSQDPTRILPRESPSARRC
jgi:hypothetical protein